MRTAFKEWALIVDSMLRGEQSLILRKGGIHEGRGGFRPEHSEFVLFPTRFHQQADRVREPAASRWDQARDAWPSEDEVRVEGWARLNAVRCIDSLEQARALERFHVWNPDVIEERFDWGRRPEIHAMLLRIYRFPSAVLLPMDPSYGGCRSWVELLDDIPVEDSRPVLSDEDFARVRSEFEAVCPEPTSG